MSDLSALAEKLSALAGDAGDVFEDGARVIANGDGRAPVKAILDAVDDTVLERKLRVEIDGKRIDLIAAGRRLRGILTADGASGDDQSVMGQVLSREEPEVVAAAGKMINNRCAGAKRITVRSLPPDPFGVGGERGISARGLAGLWDVAAPEPAVAETTAEPAEDGGAMAQFLSSNAAALTATMHVNNGEMIKISGDYKTLQNIWNEQVLQFRKSHSRFLDPADGPQLVCLEGALENGDAAAMAVDGDDVALMAYDPAHLDQMLTSWRSLTS
ncbi:MAG: hypothetical protein AAFU41_15545 [Pseudomonadota bacterium]